MTKKTRMAVVFVLALAALFLLPAISFASPTHTKGKTVTASFAFTGLITKGAGKDTSLTGGLTIAIGEKGYFHGNFHLPDGTQISVSGRVKSDGSLKITFYNAKGHPIIKGQGTPNKDGEYTGPFQVYSGKDQVASGIWSALPVANPSNVLALAFVGKVVEGPDTGVTLAGPIVLDKSTLKGTLSLATGAVIPVSAQVNGDDIKVVFNLGNGVQIIGTGELTENPANGLDKGFKGPFSGPASGDEGKWVAYFFKF